MSWYLIYSPGINRRGKVCTLHCVRSELSGLVDYIRVHREQLNFNKFYLVSANCSGELVVAKTTSNSYFHVRDIKVLRSENFVTRNILYSERMSFQLLVFSFLFHYSLYDYSVAVSIVRSIVEIPFVPMIMRHETVFLLLRSFQNSFCVRFFRPEITPHFFQ